MRADREQRERDRTREEALEALEIRVWRVPAERVERDVDGVLEDLASFIDGLCRAR
ncbi:MAG: hypothetical protein U5Q44_08985 [Dehalococcoidia bacterium]|nr:hypothetical protein [Dehalococcoidia bacterium]